ncbi:MAG: gluconate 2-dehydrogenase subunit 3 family protein [Actinomycetota bacterium]
MGSAVDRSSAPAGDEASALLFLSEHEAATLDALASRILPGDASDPGASEAQALAYIDRALAGFLRDLQSVYRAGLRELDRFAWADAGKQYAALSAKQQDALLETLDQEWLRQEGESRPAAESEGAPRIAALARFFAIVREHVVQGTFCDPEYGGNCGGVGWRLVGFPGAQFGYSAEQMQRGFDAGAIAPMTLADLRAQMTATRPTAVAEDG